MSQEVLIKKDSQELSEKNEDISEIVDPHSEHSLEEETCCDDGPLDVWDFLDPERKQLVMPLFEQYLKDLGGIFSDQEINYGEENNDAYAEVYVPDIYESSPKVTEKEECVENQNQILPPVHESPSLEQEINESITEKKEIEEDDDEEDDSQEEE